MVIERGEDRIAKEKRRDGGKREKYKYKQGRSTLGSNEYLRNAVVLNGAWALLGHGGHRDNFTVGALDSFETLKEVPKRREKKIWRQEPKLFVTA